jgi:hypothetical protein
MMECCTTKHCMIGIATELNKTTKTKFFIFIFEFDQHLRLIQLFRIIPL